MCVCVCVGGCTGVCVNGRHGTSSLGMTQATCHANKDISDALLWSPVGEPASFPGSPTLGTRLGYGSCYLREYFHAPYVNVGVLRV